LIDQVIIYVEYRGYLPAKMAVGSGFHAHLSAMTTGMRTVTVYSVPCFIDKTLDPDGVEYYLDNETIDSIGGV
jgi:hypothetical protein